MPEKQWDASSVSSCFTALIMDLIKVDANPGIHNTPTKKRLIIVQAFPYDYQWDLDVPILGPMMDRYAT